MNHDAPATITPKASAQANPPAPAAAQPKAPGGLWPFLRTLFIGSAGLAVLAVIATLAGSAWLTANQRAEAEKAQPWADPSFTTTAVTTGGMLARFMDADGDLSNGHSYIKGIYDLWKVKHPKETIQVRSASASLPPLWTIELNSDIALQTLNEAAERERFSAQTKRENYEVQMNSFSSGNK